MHKYSARHVHKFSFAIKIAINEQKLCCSNRINYKTTDNPNNASQYQIISNNLM